MLAYLCIVSFCVWSFFGFSKNAPCKKVADYTCSTGVQHFILFM